MKTIKLALLCAAVLALPLSAEVRNSERFAAPLMLPDLQTPYSELLQNAAIANGKGPLRPEPNVVLEGSENAFVFPIVGSAAAGGGLFFRSETVIYNRLNRQQNIAIYYFPIGGGAANCLRPAKQMRLDANAWYVWTDFVADALSTNGLGAVIVLAVTSTGNVDTTARIDGNSRIWTPQPGTNGTTSQNFPSVSLKMPAGGQSSFGLRHDEFYRSNYGIFNYDTVPRTFRVRPNGLRGNPVTFNVALDACSATLSPLQGGPYGSYELYIEAVDGRALFFTFGSSVDNATGDSWSVIGRSF